MSIKQLIGITLLASPFVALMFVMVRDIGIMATLQIWGAVGALVATVALGMFLITSGCN